MRVGVVGAGIAGLSAARALRLGGADVVVLERAERVGGVLRTEAVDGYVHEHAANGFLGGTEGGAIDLARELGVVLEEASPAAKKRWIYLDGGLRALPSNPLQLVTTDLLSWRGKLTALAEPFQPARPAADESVADFAARRLGPEIAHAIVGPFVTGVFAGRADELSLRAAFPQLADLEERGGLVRGGISRLLEARRRRRDGGRKRQGSRLAAPVGGVEMLVEALADQLRPTLRLGRRITALRRRGDVTELDVDGETETFDHVVLATPAYASAGLVRDAAPRLGAVLDAIPYAPIAIVYLGFDESHIEHPLDGFGFLVADGEPLRMLGSVFESVLWSQRAPEGRVLLRCMFGGGRDPEAAQLDDRELIDIAHRDLDATLGLRADAEHTAVVRWERGIAQYTLGHLDRVQQAEELARPLGVTLAGSAYRVVAVTKLIADATRVARDILGSGQRAATFLVLVAVATAMIACGGKSKSSTGPDDGGDAAGPAPASRDTPAGVAPPYRLAPTDDEGRVLEAGALEVIVQWPHPPAELVRSPGRTECGSRRPSPLDVHTMFGVRGAVVEVLDVDRGRAPAEPSVVELGVRECLFDDRVVVAPRLDAPLEVVNDDRRRHRVELTFVEEGADRARPLGVAPLPVVGHRRRVEPERPGIVRAALAGDGAARAWVVMPRHPYVAETDDRGRVSFDQLPAGRYRVRAWHPPLTPEGEPRIVEREVEVVTGDEALLRLPLEGEPWQPAQGTRGGTLTGDDDE